jgi:hypothetical protein
MPNLEEPQIVVRSGLTPSQYVDQLVRYIREGDLVFAASTADIWVRKASGDALSANVADLIARLALAVCYHA